MESAVSPSPRSRARSKRLTARAFAFRAGVQLAGSPLTCDAAGSASDLVFLSHAQAVVGRRGRFLLRRAGRQELLTTEGTLALLGRTGETLRPHVLPAGFGRPFSLGGMRLELFPSGHLPGSASLLCEADGRRLVYAGAIKRGTPGFGATACEVRSADAICLDGTFGDPRFNFPPTDESLAAVESFVKESLAAGRAPVLLVPPFESAMDVAHEMARLGFSLRGHRAVVAASALFRTAGARVPVIQRFFGKLGKNEVLLWTPEARDAAQLGGLDGPRVALVSGHAVDPAVGERLRVDFAIPLSNRAGHDELLAYVDATGAQEVAIHHGASESLAQELARRGHLAYLVSPPRQMALFSP